MGGLWRRGAPNVFTHLTALVALAGCSDKPASRPSATTLAAPVDSRPAASAPEPSPSAQSPDPALEEPCRGKAIDFEEAVHACRCRRGQFDDAELRRCDEGGAHDDQAITHLRASLEPDGVVRAGADVRLRVRWTNVTDAPVKVMLDRKAKMTISIVNAKGRAVRGPDCPAAEEQVGALVSIDPAVVTLEPRGELRATIDWSATIPPGQHCASSKAPPLSKGRYRLEVWGDPIWSYPRELAPGASREIDVE